MNSPRDVPHPEHRRALAISRPFRKPVAWIAAIALTSMVSVLLRSQIPLSTLTPRAGRFDDSLMVRGAGYLERGQWLGPFDLLTLSKGPSYPMFIALTDKIGISLKVGEQLTYLLAALCLAGCVWVVTHRRALSFAVYFVLAFDPVKFGEVDGRILRDGWSSSLALLFFASFFLALYGALTRVRIVWVIAFSLLSGLSGAAFLLCREEGAWLVPSLAVVALGLCLSGFLKWRRRTPVPRDTSPLFRNGMRVGLALVITVVALYAPIAGVKLKNQEVYGSALTNDMSAGWIFRAYADWSRVKAGTPRRYVPISRTQRQAVYQISPAARQLMPTLEDPHNGSLSGGCTTVKVCDDFTGGWMIWAMRSGAANAGHFGSESEAQAYFHQISDDISRACNRGSLLCADRLPAALQPLQRASLRPWLRSLADLSRTVALTSDLATLQTLPMGITPAEREVIKQSVSGVPASQAAQNNELQTLKSRSWLFQGLSEFYLLLLPLMLVLALIGTVAALRRPRWPGIALSVLSVGLSVGVVTHLLLLALINSSEFVFIGAGRYMLPARVFLLAFAVVGCAQLIDGVRAKGQTGSRSAKDPDQSRPRQDDCLFEPSAKGHPRDVASASPDHP